MAAVKWRHFLRGVAAGSIVTGALSTVLAWRDTAAGSNNETDAVTYSDSDASKTDDAAASSKKDQPQPPPQRTGVLDQNLDKFGRPRTHHEAVHTHFVSLADFRTRSPAWVLQHLTPQLLAAHNVDRTGITFTRYTGQVSAAADADAAADAVDTHQLSWTIPRPFQAQNGDYLRSGWSRGHLCPAGDSHVSEWAMRDTFMLGANIVPQDLNMNMFYWNRLERWVRSLVTPDNANGKPWATGVWVLSGPLYLADGTLDVVNVDESLDKSDSDSDSTMVVTGTAATSRPPVEQLRLLQIGDRRVTVPTHMFKAIIAERSAVETGDGSTATETYFAAFVLPNKPIPGDIPITDFQVSMATLETWAGFEWDLSGSNTKAQVSVADPVETDKDSSSNRVTKALPKQYRDNPFPNLCGAVPCVLMDANVHRAMHLVRDINGAFKRWYAERAWKELQQLGPQFATPEVEEAFHKKLADLKLTEEEAFRKKMADMKLVEEESAAIATGTASDDKRSG